MNARPFTSHNHATRAAAVAECMRAGMTPWHHAELLLFAMPGDRVPYGVARYVTGDGPRYCIARLPPDYTPGQAESTVDAPAVAGA